MLDMKQPMQLLTELADAAKPRPIDPSLPLKLAKARREIEESLAPGGSDSEWWKDASPIGLVHAGLGAVARWFTKTRA